MGSSTHILTYYGLLRLVRCRGVAALLLVAPVVAASVDHFVAGRQAWICAVVLVGLVASVVWARVLFDRAFGLTSSILCTPVRESEVAYSQVLVAVVVLAVQALIFAGVRAVWPGGGA